MIKDMSTVTGSAFAAHGILLLFLVIPTAFLKSLSVGI